MTYIPEEAKVIYQSKDAKEHKIFDPLEWIAAMSSHVPNKGESRRAGVRYYGYYPALAGCAAANAKSITKTAWYPTS